MNFENMPELKFSFGYPIAIGPWPVSETAMFLFFRKAWMFD